MNKMKKLRILAAGDLHGDSSLARKPLSALSGVSLWAPDASASIDFNHSYCLFMKGRLQAIEANQ